jgi:transcriptional regulator with XRE-family HTH domain
MTKKNDFAYRLKQLRLERKYTQEDLAAIVKVSTKTIGNYEQRISEPQAVLLLALAQALDVTPDYLLLGENHMKTYTCAIIAELEQLTTFDQIKQIKDEELNSTIVSHLELSDDLVDTIRNKWNDSIFKKSYCTRPYVQEVILKYCQNRQKYINAFSLNDGMIVH